MQILTLLARHGTAKYADAVPSVQQLFARGFAGVGHRLIIADNAQPPGHRGEEAGVEVFGASNEGWEFTAWDDAIAAVGGALDGYDWVNLATSAYRQLYNRYLDLFTTALVGGVRHRSAVLGHIDYTAEPYLLDGVACSAWMRSSFLFVRPAALRLLGRVDARLDRRAIFSGDPAAPFRDDAPVSPSYRRNITSWLTGAGTGQGVEWHSRFQLSPGTLGFFEAKALAILNEQSLSNRLRAVGCPLVDITWLSGAASPVPFPDLREQITRRPVDAAPGTIRIEVLPPVLPRVRQGWRIQLP